MNPSVFWREATFGYRNWGGRLPRGNLWCRLRGSGLQRVKALNPRIAGSIVQPLVRATRCAFFTGVVTTFFLSFLGESDITVSAYAYAAAIPSTKVLEIEIEVIPYKRVC